MIFLNKQYNYSNNVIDSYRIKLAIDISHENNSKNDQKSYKDIIHAINIHRNAIKFALL